MKSKPSKFLEQHRLLSESDASYGNNGAFQILGGATDLRIVASDGEDWDHVSVSTPDRCPTWDEMCYVKGLFFRGDEWAIQLHPPPAENINCHPYCLHLWRPQVGAILTPPGWMVGPKVLETRR